MLQGRCRRCLLSIGIDYAFGALQRAEKDAEVLAFKFQTRNYRTRLAPNLSDRLALSTAIHDFAQCLEESTELIVVYFAGYAVAAQGRVKLQLRNATSCGDLDPAHVVGVDELLDLILRARRPNCFVLAILDFDNEIDLPTQEACTQGLVGSPWATLWSTGAPEASLGYGSLVRGMLHHMVVDPQLQLTEIGQQLDRYVGDERRVVVFGTRHAPLLFSQEVWNPQSMGLSTIGRLRSTSTVQLRHGLDLCCRLAVWCVAQRKSACAKLTTNYAKLC